MRRAALCIALALLAGSSLTVNAADITVATTDKMGRPLPNVVVFATPESGAVPPGTPTTEVVNQRGMEFAPFLTVVQKGSKVEFPNLDRTTHHVKSFSSTKEFEFFLSATKTDSPDVVFDKSGPVIVYCMLHDWMRAYIYVVDTPWFGKTTAEGRARLANLPPGRYRVTAWHPDQGQVLAPLVQTVAVVADRETALSFLFPLNPRKPREPKAGAVK